MTIKRPAVTFPTCKQSERGAYRSNNKLLGINDHVAAEHNSTSLICMGARPLKEQTVLSNIVTKLEPDMFLFIFCISDIAGLQSYKLTQICWNGSYIVYNY